MATHAARGDIRDRGLAAAGEDLIEWAAREMPVLLAVRRRFERERPLEGLRVAARLPVTSETANLAIALGAAGADVALCASSPLSTNDAVAAALAHSHGIRTYAIEGEDDETHHAHVAAALAHRPDLTMDDGADLVAELHRGGGRLLDRVVGGTEATAAGVARLRAMAEHGVLRYPIVAVSEAHTGRLFDRVLGEARPVNPAAEGQPAAVTDMSLASQALSLEHLARNHARLERRVHDVPEEIDAEVARLELKAMGVAIDTLTEEQVGYLDSWEEGT